MSDSLNVSLSLSLPLCSRLDLVNLVPELGSNVMTFPGELVQVSPQTPKPILNVTVQLFVVPGDTAATSPLPGWSSLDGASTANRLLDEANVLAHAQEK